jgi:DNA repair protein RadA/Sms
VASDAVAFGEVALSGEIRSAGLAGLRLKEAEKLGFRSALAPPATKGSGQLRTRCFATLGALVDHLAPGDGER